MDFKTLECFVAVVETRSFTRAARESYISQPALSRRLSELERELGAKLLERTTRLVSLTPAGELCYNYAKKLLADKESFLDALLQSQRQLAGTITLWFSPMMEFQITSLLSFLTKELPNVEIRFFQQRARSLEDAFCSGEVDILVGPSFLLPQTEHTRSFPVLPARFCATLPTSHPLAREKSVSLQQLSGLPLICLGTEDTAPIEASLLEMCRLRHYDCPGVLYAEDPYHQQMLVAMGKGVALLPSTAKGRAPADLCYLSISDCTLNADRMCGWQSDNPNPVLPAVLRAVETWKASFSSGR